MYVKIIYPSNANLVMCIKLVIKYRLYEIANHSASIFYFLHFPTCEN